MRIIPLHSIVITVGTSNIKEQEVLSKFDSYEITNKNKISESLFGSVDKRHNNETLGYELFRFINLKLISGERVVLSGSNLNKNKRINISNLGKKYNIPVYYIITHDDQYSIDRNKVEYFEFNEEEIMNGDGVANVIDYRVEDFTAIKKFPNENILESIIQRGYKGITIAGDIHGNLEALRNSLDWALARNLLYVQLGDLVDYGNYPIECVELLYDRIIRGKAINVIGNHERKLERWLQQEKNIKHNPDYLKYKSAVNLSDSNRTTVDVITKMSPAHRRIFENKFNTLMNLGRHHYNIGNILVTHAAASKEMFQLNSNRLYGKYESLCLYGETTPDSTNTSYVNSYNWVDNIPSDHMAFVGHDIRNKILSVKVINDDGGVAVFLDTGSGKGGSLSTTDLVIQDNKLVVQSSNRW